MTEEPTYLTERCGPHCGVKDGKTGHCTGCHRTHGKPRARARHEDWRKTK